MIATTPVLDHRMVQQQFQSVIDDMVDANARLDQLSHSNYFPSRSWSERFDRMSANLDDARTGYLELTRDHSLHAELGIAVRGMAKNSGTLANMSRHEQAFGDWRNSLTSEISVARRAVDALFDIGRPPSTHPGMPPVPGTPGHGPVGDAVQGAIQLVSQSLDSIRSLPVDDRGSDMTKQGRIAAYELNMQAQKLIEPLFDTAEGAVASQLRTADAYLEDANWQLAKKPSPDGRFNGVDIPGAIRDSEAALDQLNEILTHA